MWRAVVALGVGLGFAASASAQCDPATQFAYTFRNACAEPIWIGQRSTQDAASYPPQSGNWALSGSCTSNADCPTGACDTEDGTCTCATAADCPGGAACAAGGKCATTAVFCMPQSWSSGSFWPRTGCTLDASTSPETLSCATGACYDTNNSGQALLDCSAANGGGSPTNPVTQFEVTSTAATINYDVSLAAGYNVETFATPIGGGQVVPGTPSTDVVACYDVGCTADLNASCPPALQVVEGGAVIGCLDPCTRCQRPDPPATLQCDTALPDTWTCGTSSGPVTHLDLYCAKNTADGTAQASPNQGTPTAFSQLDCPPVTSFVQPTFASGYALPAGQGVCLYTSPPQSTTPGFNDYRWADAVNGTSSCGAGQDGTPCGGYRTTQSDGSYYAGALGYTCQTATFPADGGSQVAYLCMPPTTSGLGACTSDEAGGLPLYAATGGVPNASWLQAAAQAGGGTPYYVPFKTACQAAYAWQYDDIASGFGCTAASVAPGGAAFSGFAVTFCNSTSPGPGPDPDAVPVALKVHGRATKVDRPGRGVVRLKGMTTLPTSVALEDATLAIADLLDAVGADGELVSGPWSLEPKRRKKKVAIFTTAPGVRPRVKVVLHRRRPKKEKVKVHVLARGATIARPAACAAGPASLPIETALLVGGGGAEYRAGAVGQWRCKKKLLRSE